MESILDFSEQPIQNAYNLHEIKILSQLWQEKPVLLLFLRRLGCRICRAYAQEIQENLYRIEKKATVIALSFEVPGTGSDSDNSFSNGQYWKGPMYVVPKSMYETLFGRKTLFQGMYGIFTIDPVGQMRAEKRNIKGNLQGDGFVLGGQFIISPDGKVLLDHRQRNYGDDATVDDILNILNS